MNRTVKIAIETSLAWAIVIGSFAYALNSSGKYTEKTIGTGLKFHVLADHKFEPVLPIKLVVRQEDGGLLEPGIVSCDVIDRRYDNSTIDTLDSPDGAVKVVGNFAVLKCKDKKFIVESVIYSK